MLYPITLVSDKYDHIGHPEITHVQVEAESKEEAIQKVKDWLLDLSIEEWYQKANNLFPIVI